MPTVDNVTNVNVVSLGIQTVGHVSAADGPMSVMTPVDVSLVVTTLVEHVVRGTVN